MARPKLPDLPAAPLSARTASISLFLLSAYAALAVISYLDVLSRLVGALLSGGSLPNWALLGFVSSAVVLVFGSLVARTLYRSAKQMSDQDPRASIKLIFPFVSVVVIHAILVTGPLSRWAQAAPLIGSAWLGVFAVTLVPLAALAAVLATVARRQALAWLNALPD
jgi:hypothetical protein